MAEDVELKNQIANQLEQYRFKIAGSKNIDDEVYPIKFTDHPSTHWLIKLIYEREKAVRKYAAERVAKLQDHKALYGDGKIAYFNNEAFVPMSKVLELSAQLNQSQDKATK